MSNEGRHFPKIEQGAEHQKSSDKPLEGATITNREDNHKSDEVKGRDALRSFKLTRDGQNSFTIVDDKTEYKDLRALRQDAEDTNAVNFKSKESMAGQDSTAYVELKDKISDALSVSEGSEN
jgi:hypothetical protein